MDKEFIGALDKIIKAFGDIIDKDERLKIFKAEESTEKISELKKLTDRCKKIRDKLESGKFTVAIVGLENSGKSSLGNALIGIREILPTGHSRCTFTITKAVAGEENKGKVVLYTLKEFKEKFAYSVIGISTDNYRDEVINKIRQKLIGNPVFQNVTAEQIKKFLASDAKPKSDFEKNLAAAVKKNLTAVINFEDQKTTDKIQDMLNEIDANENRKDDVRAMIKNKNSILNLLGSNGGGILTEFKNNFSELIKQISKSELRINFDSVTWDQIETHLMAAPEKDDEKESFNQKVADAKAMTDNMHIILNIFGGTGIFEFKGDDLLATSAFKQFITGKFLNDLLNNNGYPYAVKEITIYSTNFQNMKDIVLYDVPGFDSTTELHKAQTAAMIDDADAIILVVSVFEGAELRSTHTAMFSSGKDKYGTLYKDKVFVFGNKIDLSKNGVEAKQKRELLRQTVREARLSDEDGKYIVCGSAEKYHAGQEKNCLENNLHLTAEIVGGICGVELLRAKLDDYYQNVRRKVIKERVGKILRDASGFLKNIHLKCERIDSEDGGEYYYDAVANFEKFLHAAAEPFWEEIGTVTKDVTFSKQLKEDIKEIFPSYSEDEAAKSALKEIRNGMRLNMNGAFPAGDVDKKFREKIFGTFSDEIKTVIKKSVTSREEELNFDLRDIFLKNMGMKKDSPFRAELEQSVEELFKQLRTVKTEERPKSNLTEPLAFGKISLLLEVLIRCPLNSERLDKVIDKNNFQIFRSLANYYAESEAKTDGDKFKTQAEFFSKILTQQGFKTRRAGSDSENFSPDEKILKDSVAVEKELQDFFTNNLKFTPVFAGNLPLKQWAKKLAENGKDFQAEEHLKKKFKSCTVDDDWKAKNVREKISVLETVFNNYINSLNNETPTNDAMSESTFELPKKITESWLEKISKSNDIEIKNEDDLLGVLDEDIKNLRAFMSQALVEELHMETEFIATMIYNLDVVRFAREDEDRSALLRNWVLTNTRKIYDEEFKNIDKKKADNAERRKISENVKIALEELNKHLQVRV